MKKRFYSLKRLIRKEEHLFESQVGRVISRGPDLKQKFFPLLHLFSKMVLLFSGIFLLPALVSYIYDDGLILTYTTSAATVAVSGAILWILTQKHQREFKPKDSILFVIILWVGFTLFASLPIYLHLPSLSFTDAYFEAAAALTTTGVTALTNIDSLPPSLNFWRHFLNWLGGMGIIVVGLVVLPMLGSGAAQIYKIEVPKMESNDKQAPRINKMARYLWGVYCGFTVLCALCLKLAGMNWFDAICHALTTLSLTGYSTHDEGLAYFNSFTIELILIIFMLIAAINFSTHFTALHNKKLLPYLKNQEVKYAFWILICSIIFSTFYLWLHPKLGNNSQPLTHYSFIESFRLILFQFVSFATTTGFTTTNYVSVWPDFIVFWMLFLTTFMAGTGSTGGGIKMSRAIILLKFSLREMTLLLHPNAVKTVKFNGGAVPERVAFSILAFIFVYIITIIMFTFILMLSGLDYFSSFSAAVSCITNTGTGFGMIDQAHNFASLTMFQKWVSMLAMLMGRMEIFSILILFTPGFWRK